MITSMIYKTRRPRLQLEPYVDCIWLLASGTPSTAQQPEIVLPDGKMELIVHFGDHFEKLERNRFEKQARTLFSGQITEKIVLRGSGEIGIVAIRFKPGGASRFFRFPHHEILDQVIRLEDILGRDSSVLEEQILNAKTHDERMLIMEGFLVDRMLDQESLDGLILQACRYIVQSGGEYTVRDLERLIGLSERQLERRFKVEVGLTPKMLSRIVRFQRFMALSHDKNLLLLTDAALMCGYYDQAHFIRDFKAFAGISPSIYLAQPHKISDFFTSPT